MIYRHTFTWIDAVRALDGPRDNATSRVDRGAWAKLSASTLDEARRMAVEGWIDGLATLQAREPRLRVEEIPRPILAHDMTGSEVDIGAYMSGVPECMLDYVTVPQPKQLITIGIDRVANANVTADQLLQVGQSVLVAVRTLIARGYPVELWACIGTTTGGNNLDLRVKVQSAGEPLNIARIAFWTAHPASFRRAMLALMETLPEDERRALRAYDSEDYGHALPNVARDDFSEWAPTYGQNVEGWLAELLGRRA